MLKKILLLGASMVALTTEAEAASFVYTGDLAEYVAPTTGWYDIFAAGASGGDNTVTQGGLAGTVAGRIRLTAGSVLNILVGGRGLSFSKASDIGGAGGGGGGTFVFLGSQAQVVAGGGGGAGYAFAGGAGDGRPAGNGSGGAGGSDAIFNGGGGGGGAYGNGGDGAVQGATGGRSFLNGGAGGSPAPQYSAGGGFGGGGGGAYFSGGGGGGFTGGSAGGGDFGRSATSGTSYLLNGATNRVFDTKATRGDGLFNIDPSAVPEPGTWAMMVLGFGMVGGVLRSRRLQVPALGVT